MLSQYQASYPVLLDIATSVSLNKLLGPIWRDAVIRYSDDKPLSLNLSHFVEDQNDPSTSQILPSWPSVQWWGRAPPVRSIPPVQRRSADESCAGTERTRHILAGYTC